MDIIKEKENKYLKIMGIIAAAFFCASLVPLLLLSVFNRASGDDFSFGTLTRQAFIKTGSLAEVFKASFQKISEVYEGWQGTWSSIFLFTLQPEVFHEKAYVLVTPLIIILWVVAVTFVMHFFLVKMAEFDKDSFLFVNFSFLLLNMQFIPGVQSALFWFNGIIHYQLPFLMMIFLLYLLMSYVQKPKLNYFLGIALILAFLGGSSYQPALLAFLLAVLAIAYLLLARRWKDSFFLLVPLFLFLAGLTISMLAPGNKVRGGEDFGLSFKRAAMAVGESILMAISQGFRLLGERPLVIAGLLFILLIITCVQLNKEKPCQKYPYPGIFLLLSFLLYASVYAPEIYSGSWVSQGVGNIYYQCLLLFIIANWLYFMGYLKRYLAEKHGKTGSPQLANKKAIIFVMGLCLVITVFNYRNVFDSVMYQSYSLIKTGRAAEYKRLKDIQTRILLDDGISNAVLPGIFEDYRPLANSVVGIDKDHPTNQITASFYGKDSVIAIDREEWNQLYEQTE
ncbi:MAG: DUF6056 family protein [Lachnospiraceae bacterium]|nr:DUF6056 family protein [Lachnospiraceae bacterium]